jgi:hypothetical protein
MAVARADNARGGIGDAARSAFISIPPEGGVDLCSIPPEGGVDLCFEKLFDEAANACANPSFQGIKPIIAEKMLAFAGANCRRCAIPCHGVISIGALTPILFVFTSRRLRHLQIPTTSETAPHSLRNLSSCFSKLTKRDPKRPFTIFTTGEDMRAVHERPRVLFKRLGGIVQPYRAASAPERSRRSE